MSSSSRKEVKITTNQNVSQASTSGTTLSGSTSGTTLSDSTPGTTLIGSTSGATLSGSTVSSAGTYWNQPPMPSPYINQFLGNHAYYGMYRMPYNFMTPGLPPPFHYPYNPYGPVQWNQFAAPWMTSAAPPPPPPTPPPPSGTAVNNPQTCTGSNDVKDEPRVYSYNRCT